VRRWSLKFVVAWMALRLSSSCMTLNVAGQTDITPSILIITNTKMGLDLTLYLHWNRWRELLVLH
jgi:hypothetical protein